MWRGHKFFTCPWQLLRMLGKRGVRIGRLVAVVFNIPPLQVLGFFLLQLPQPQEVVVYVYISDLPRRAWGDAEIFKNSYLKKQLPIFSNFGSVIRSFKTCSYIPILRILYLNILLKFSTILGNLLIFPLPFFILMLLLMNLMLLNFISVLTSVRPKKLNSKFKTLKTSYISVYLFFFFKCDAIVFPIPGDFTISVNVWRQIGRCLRDLRFLF